METEEQGQETEPEDTEPTGDEGGSEPSGDTQEASAKPGSAKERGKERSRNRYRDMQTERDTATKALDELRRSHGETQTALAELRTRMEERERRGTQNDAATEYKSRLGSLRQQWESYAAMASNAKTREEQRKYLDSAYEIEEQMNDLRSEWRDLNRPQQRQAENTNNPLQIAIASEFPWVVTNEDAREQADVYWNRALRAGKQPSHALLREAMLRAAKDFGLGGNSSGPNQQSRQRFAGIESREGEGGGGGGSHMTAEDVKNNRHFKSMAERAYPQLEADKAYATWAKEIGSKIATA